MIGQKSLPSRQQKKEKSKDEIIGDINSSYTYNKIINWKPWFTELSEAYVMLIKSGKTKI